MTKDRTPSRQEFASAIARAGSGATTDQTVSYLLAPSLATRLSRTCSSGFLFALHKSIAVLERRGNPPTPASLDESVLKEADKLYCRANPIGGCAGVVLGGLCGYFVLPPAGVLVGLFFPGVPLCLYLASLFQELALSRSDLGRQALSMA